MAGGSCEDERYAGAFFFFAFTLWLIDNLETKCKIMDLKHEIEMLQIDMKSCKKKWDNQSILL